MAKKIQYADAKKILQGITDGALEAGSLKELLSLNQCSVEELRDRLRESAYCISGITSKTHAKALRADIQKDRLSEAEIMAVYDINAIDSKSKEELLFQIDKWLRIRELKDECKAQLNGIEVEREVRRYGRNPLIPIDWTEMEKEKEEYLSNRKSILDQYNAEVKKIIAEKFIMKG